MGRDALGKRQRRYATVRGNKAAQRWLRELLSGIDRGMELPHDKTLMRDWLDRWLAEQVVPHRRQRTKERYENLVERHINPHIGRIELSKLGPEHIQTLESTLATTMAAKTVQLVHTVPSGALRYAMRKELIHRNPASLVSPPPLSRRGVETPDIHTVQAAHAHARVNSHPLYACIHPTAYTGLRRGEALGLLWERVDLDLGRIFVEGSLVRSVERGLILEPPKTHSGWQVVDLDRTTVGRDEGAPCGPGHREEHAWERLPRTPGAYSQGRQGNSSSRWR